MPLRRRELAPTREELLKSERRLVAPLHSGSDLAVHVVYPNTYWVAMSNLGFQAVYSIFAAARGVTVERGFLPAESEQDEARRTSWRTFESERNLSDCDLLGFSLSFETDYPHLFRILKNQKLLQADAALRAERADRQPLGNPILIAGGTSVTLNPEPVADYLDAIVLGEAEELIPEMIEVLRGARATGLPRTETLRELARLEGVYVPVFYRPSYAANGSVSSFETVNAAVPRARRRFVRDISKFPTYSRVLTPQTEFSSMFLAETGRGCEVGCRFCVAGYIYRPVRKRSAESLRETVKIGLENSTAIGFVGAAVSSHRAITELASSVAQAGARASLSSIMSQRATKELAASITESEYKTVALAPEAGSERLRFAAGKRVTNDQVLTAVANLAEAGIQGFKLYFIVGLPTENDEDIDAIVELARACQKIAVEKGRALGLRNWLVLSVNPFVPKACTPFQWEPMLSRRELEAKIKRIEKSLRSEAKLELKFEPPRESGFQALLSRGDRRVGRLLEFMEENNLEWKWLMQRSSEVVVEGVPPVDFYVLRRIPFTEPLPWEIVDSLISRELLQREALRAHGAADLNSRKFLPESSEVCL